MNLYTGPIIDTHHHLWRRQDIAWLNPPLTPKMFGDFFGLCRDFPIEEWRHDYNHQRPHGALGKLTPSEYAEQRQQPRSEAANLQLGPV